MQHPLENTGLISEEPKPKDWVAGSTSQLPYSAVLETADWRPFAPPGERQSFRKFDSMACVSYSLLDCLEVQLRQQAAERNNSDRFLAKMSGTTPQGNSLSRVADTFRISGDVIEDRWPASDDFDWSAYYSAIPQDVIDKAAKYLPGVQFNYEFLPIFTDEDLRYHLKQAPLQVTVCAGQGWNQENVPPIDGEPNHAVCLLHVDAQGYRYVLDHYAPFIKRLDPKFKLFAKLKPTIKPKAMNQAKVVKSKTSPTVYICYPVPSLDYLKQTSDLQGITVPNPIPSSDSL